MIENYLFFTRYLENRKSYRDERGTVLKGKVPRFQRSFIRRPEASIFRVITIRSFLNFNRVLKYIRDTIFVVLF